MVHSRRKYLEAAAAVGALTFGPVWTTRAMASPGASCTLGGCAARDDGVERVDHGRTEREHDGEDEGECDKRAGGPRRDQRFGDRPSSSSSSSVPSSSSSSAPSSSSIPVDDECAVAPPVIPEAPWAVLLPLSAAGTVLVVLRRRTRPALVA